MERGEYTDMLKWTGGRVGCWWQFAEDVTSLQEIQPYCWCVTLKWMLYPEDKNL